MAFTKIPVAPGDVISSSWGNHIQTQYEEANAEINTHANDNLAHNATPSPFANRIMSRDGNGRAAIADPTADSHIANMRYVKSMTSSANVTLINTIHADVDGSEYPLGVTGMAIVSGEDGYPINVGTVLNINPSNEHRFVQLAIYNGTSSGLQGNIYVRYWRSAEGWSEWVLQHNTNNLPNPAQTNVNNTFNKSQFVKNGSTYLTWSVRRDIGSDEVRADIAVSAGGNAELTKRVNNEIVERLGIVGEGELRLGSKEVWHEGNLSNPAQTNIANEFTQNQIFGGDYPIILKGRASDTPGKRNFRWDISGQELRLQALDDTLTYVSQPLVIDHDGNVNISSNNLTVGGTSVALQNGSYANLRARATTKADVGLSRVPNIGITQSTSNPSGGSNGDIWHVYE